MYEIAKVRQDDPALRFRWFTTEKSDFDLYVWEQKETQEIVRFQIYYDRFFEEKMVEWKGSKNLWYALVDNDDSRNFVKASPILKRDTQNGFNLNIVINLFENCSSEIDQSVKGFVSTFLKAHI